MRGEELFKSFPEVQLVGQGAGARLPVHRSDSYGISSARGSPDDKAVTGTDIYPSDEVGLRIAAVVGIGCIGIDGGLVESLRKEIQGTQDTV